jgi:class 3 adenylate cyclase
MDTGHGGTYDPVMPVCARCGEDNPARASFCLACAAPLTAPAAARREERKRVSVLFCDLVGFTSRAERLDVEDVRGLLGPYYQRLRAELERYGGTVEKFIGDAVMALFGAPTAHEDDPERAVRAALAIRDAIAELNQADPSLGLQVRVGVTSGEALVVLDARPVEGEGMASGDVVNTAARLQAAEGKTDPVPVWLAVAARANLGVEVDQAGRAGLVGREREVRLLESALERVRGEHAPQPVTLVGVPGSARAGWSGSCCKRWRPTRSWSPGATAAACPTGRAWHCGRWARSSRPRPGSWSPTRRTWPRPSWHEPSLACWVTRPRRLGDPAPAAPGRAGRQQPGWRGPAGGGVRGLAAVPGSLAEQGPAPTRWFQAAAAMAAGRFAEAADRFAEIGSLPDEAFARLRAAERLLAVGARTEGGAQLQRALAFFRQVGAGGYLSRAEALVAASA